MSGIDQLKSKLVALDSTCAQLIAELEWQPPQSAALSTPDPELRPLNTSARDNSARDSSSPQPHQLSSSQPSSLSSSPPPTASAASSAAAAGPQRKMSDNTHNSSSNSASPFSGAKPLLGAAAAALEAGHSSPGNLRQLQGPPPGRLGFAPRPAVAPPTRSATPPARSPPPARGSPPVVQPLSFREDGSGGGVVLPSAVSPRSRPRPPPGVGSNALRGPLRLGGPPPTPLKTPIVDRSERSLTTIDHEKALFDSLGVKRLYLTKNQLQSVPDDLVRLTELEHLNLSYNRFDRLPECITQLTTLTELLVCGNRIAELPPSIAALPLVSIDLMSNFLTTVPSALPSLTALTHLNLRRNQLATLPDSLAALGKLKVLDLGENRLTELPAAVAAALSGSLEVLELDHNQLVKLPDAIGQCTVLRRLAVEQNALKALPDAIGNLEALEELIADDNSLTALPASFGVLGKLRVLRAKRNEIGEITAANIASLAALHILDLTLNKLTALPGTLGTALPRLHQLLVGGNRLSDLPQSLAACQRLRVLSAFGNSKLTKLPPGIAQLPRLHTLHVGYCPKLESLGLVATDAEAAAVAAARAEQASKMKRAASQHRAKLSPEEALSDDTAARGTTFDDDASGADSDCDLESDPLVDSSITGPFRALRELQIAGCPNLPPLADTADAAESALGGGGKSLVELYAALGAKKADDDDADADDAAPGGAGDAGVGPVRDENGALLPSLVDAAPRIERLDAAHCGLRNVDAVIGLDNMTRLNLQCNAIESVPEALCEFSQLEELDLSLNSRLQSVPDALAQRAVDETTALEMFVDLTPVGSLPQQRRRPYTASLRMPYGFAEMLGRRPTQEDALMLEGQFGDEAAKMSLYCMFDGHAGHQAAQFCAQRFPPLLSDALAATPDAPSDALRAALAALARAFQTAVEELDPAARHCGTTALVVLVTEEAYHVANLGDTRAVLSRGGKAVRLSHDHKPVDEEERIRELGGYVIGKTTQRVNGMLGVPRSIGDFFVKPYVSEEPYVNVVARQADDDFVMLACDGVWDELDDQRVVDICKKETSAQAAAIRVRDYAYMAGSEDNISTVLVLLRDEGLEPGEVRRRRRKKSTIHVRTNSNSAAATPLHHTVR